MVHPIENSRVVSLQDVAVPRKKVIRRLGYPTDMDKINGKVSRILEEEGQKADTLLEPKGIYRLLKIASRNEGLITFQDTSFTIMSGRVSQMLRISDPVVLFMVTIGPALEEEVESLFKRDEMTRAVILDAIGSETADDAADRMHRIVIKQRAMAEGYKVTPRFSPGYGDWPVTVQGEFFKASHGDRIGISVNESSLMIPRKSVSAVLGWVRS